MDREVLAENATLEVTPGRGEGVSYVDVGDEERSRFRVQRP